MNDKYLRHLMISVFLFLVAFSLLVYWSKTEANTQIEETIVVGEEKEWTHYDEFNRIYDEIERKETDHVEILHREICDSVPKSPLCDDIEILRRVDMIAKSKEVPTGLIIGIMFAESTLSTNYNKPACKGHNNPYGIKGRKYDNGKTEWYTKTKGRPDEYGCWLYRFDSIDEATYSLANTISIGYKGCNNDVVCLSYKYVGDPNKSETSWVNRVSKFLR